MKTSNISTVSEAVVHLIQPFSRKKERNKQAYKLGHLRLLPLLLLQL